MDSATFSDSNMEACYNILVEDDGTIEPQELFYVVLTLLSDSLQSLVNISPNRSSVLIIDDDGKIDDAILRLLNDIYTPQWFELVSRWLNTHSVKVQDKSTSMLLERTLLSLARVSLWKWLYFQLPLPKKVC